MWRVEMKAPESSEWESVPGMHNESGARYMAGLVGEANPFHAVRRYREAESGERFYPRMAGETAADFEARGSGRERG